MGELLVESRRKKISTIEKKYPQAKIIDVTSKSSQPWVKFSPFYPVGDIPIPFSEGVYAKTVEGIWQGLKVFSEFDIDRSKFKIENMKGIKRTVRKHGKVLGHRKGVSGELLDYITARKLIYVPAYNYVLKNFLATEIHELMDILQHKNIILLDYETNTDINNPTKPLSHASLIAKYVMDKKTAVPL